MGQQAGPESAELARLRDELCSCRTELAQRHRELETLHEERHQLLRRCEAAEEQVRVLAAPDEQPDLRPEQPATTSSSRMRRRGRA